MQHEQVGGIGTRVRQDGGDLGHQGVRQAVEAPARVLAARVAEGPFVNPQDFSRYNLYSKISAEPSATSKLWLATSVYDGSWHGSGQIPLREVSAGRLDRFGSIDPTEGGHSDREDLTLHYDNDLTSQDTFEFLAYGSRYKLQLFSDFTFFKDTGLRFFESPDGRIFDNDAGRFVGIDDLPTGRRRAVPGDGIEQNDQRYVYGGRARYTRFWIALGLPVESRLAVETRNDDIPAIPQARRTGASGRVTPSRLPRRCS